MFQLRDSQVVPYQSFQVNSLSVGAVDGWLGPLTQEVARDDVDHVEDLDNARDDLDTDLGLVLLLIAEFLNE